MRLTPNTLGTRDLGRFASVFAAVLVAGAKRQTAVAWRSISTIFDTAGGATLTNLKTFGTSAGSVTNCRTSAAVAADG
jgi:hypothetical protein